MKKLFTLFFLIFTFLVSKAQYHVPCADLFISEYISPQGTGTSGNKTVEIYNPNGAPINMAGYTLIKANNSCTQVQSFAFPPNNIAAHGVYVINNGASPVDPIVAAASDTIWSNLNFNGNDALILVDPNGDTLDIFGIVCSNPTGGWALGASGNITQFITLVRNPSVNNGDTSWNVVQNQWTAYPANTFTYLGSHTMNPCGGNPQVNFITPLDTQIESAGVINIPVSITNPNNDTSKVTVIVGVGSATQGVDFTYTSKTLIFPPNSTTPINDTLTIIDDLLVEGNETVTLQFTNPFNTTDTLEKGMDSIYTLTIIDNDTASIIGFSTPTTLAVTENVGTIFLPVHIGTTPTSVKTVEISVVATSTSQSSDYTFTNNQTLTFNVGTNTVTVPLTIIDDCMPEGAETIVFHLTNTTGGATLNADTIFTVTILPNDTLPLVYFATPLTQSVNENVGTVTVPVTLNQTYCDTITVIIDSINTSTAWLGLDYNSISFPDTLIFYPGDTIKNITLNIIDDVLLESSEVIGLNISSAINATPSTSNAQIAIVDNDGPPTLQFNTSAASYNESAGTINIPITILNPNANITTVCVTVVSGTVSASDYQHPYQCITFAANSTTASTTDTLHIVDDFLVEGNETIVLALTNKSNLSGAPNYGIDSIITITIIDNDTTPIINFGLPKTINVNEGVGTINVPVKISNTNFAGPFTVNISATAASSATANTDYLLTNSVYTFASANSTIQVPLNIVNDCLPENTESIVLHLTNASNGATIGIDSIYTINILPNDTMPTVSFNAPTVATVNENIGIVNTIISLSHVYCDTVKVIYNITGSATNSLDYSNMITTNAVVKIPPGNLSATISVQVIDDFAVESTESIIFTMINAVHATMINTTHQIDILDNDGTVVPVIQFVNASANYNENAGTVQIGIKLTNPATTATSVTVSIIGSSATSGTDFTTITPQTITFPANSTTTQFISVNIINDLIIEPSETFVATLSNPTNNAILGTNNTFIGTILDDDLAAGTPTLYFATSSTTVNESVGTIYIPITILNANSFPLGFTFSIGGIASNFIDYSIVTNAPATVVAGVSNTNIQVNILDDLQVESNEDITLSLVATNNCIIGSSFIHTIHIKDNDVVPPPQPTGINIVDGAELIKVFPNPIDSKGILKITGISNPSVIELYNVLGSKCVTLQAENEINLSNYNLNTGVYFYKIISKLGVVKEGKIVVK